MSTALPTLWNSIVRSFVLDFAGRHPCPSPVSLGPCSCVIAHIGEELYKAGKPVCAWCSSPELGVKQFAADQNLERHFNVVHIQEEKFVCSWCGKWFKSDDLSSRCQRSHREEFVCYFEGCSKPGPYSRVDRFRQHARQEHLVSSVEVNKATRAKAGGDSLQAIKVARFPEPPELIRLRTESERLRQDLVRLVYLDQTRTAMELLPANHEALRKRNAEDRAIRSLPEALLPRTQDIGLMEPVQSNVPRRDVTETFLMEIGATEAAHLFE